MGVKECFRKDCDNVCCDAYIDDVGYICTECKDEFKDYLNIKGLDPNLQISRPAFIGNLKLFKNIPKNSYGESNTKTVDEFFREYERK